MTNNTKHSLIRVYNEVRVQDDKNDPNKRHGFQTCGIVKGEGRIEEFQMYFDAKKQANFMPPGDYEVVSDGVYLDRNGRLQMGREFVPVKSGRTAAAA